VTALPIRVNYHDFAFTLNKVLFDNIVKDYPDEFMGSRRNCQQTAKYLRNITSNNLALID
jgi:hypothetical protein